MLLGDKFKAVTPASVQNVANKYFNGDQSTTGWFIPATPNSAPAASAAKPAN